VCAELYERFVQYFARVQMGGKADNRKVRIDFRKPGMSYGDLGLKATKRHRKRRNRYMALESWAKGVLCLISIINKFTETSLNIEHRLSEAPAELLEPNKCPPMCSEPRGWEAPDAKAPKPDSAN
jgi:hypothetical protein